MLTFEVENYNDIFYKVLNAKIFIPKDYVKIITLDASKLNEKSS
jgi:hypothetical protein